MINFNIYYKCKIESKTIQWITKGQKAQQGREFRSKAQGPSLDHTACKNMKTFPDALINTPTCFAQCWYRISGTQTLIIPGGLAVKDLSAIATALGLIPESERFPGERNGNPFQYSWLRNPMDRGAWWLQSTGLQTVGHNLATEWLLL